MFLKIYKNLKFVKLQKLKYLIYTNHYKNKIPNLKLNMQSLSLIEDHYSISFDDYYIPHD